MKGFVYTIVLTTVLVLCVIILRSLEPPTDTSPVALKSEPDVLLEALPVPMTVKSSGPVISNLDSTELVTANAIALYQTGVEMLDLWHLPEAVDVFEHLVRDDPSHMQARLRLVEAYAHPMIRKERRVKASWTVARRIAIRAGYDTLLVTAFGSLFVEDDPLKAIDEFRTIVEKNPQSESARFLLAQSLLATEQPRRAEAILTEILDADPSRGRAREMLVRCSTALGRLPEAESRSRALASLYPSEPYPYVLLSRVLLLEGNIEEAAEFSNNALVIDEKYIPAILSRAHVYIAENELMAARVSFEKLLLFGDSMLSSTGMEGISYVGFLSGQFDEATDYMDDAIRLAMSAGSTRQGLIHAFRLVDYLCELGRSDAAASVVDRWIKRHGEIPASLGQIRVRISMGQSKRARQVLNRIKDNQKWRHWMRSLELDYYDFKALTYIHEENFDRAQDILNVPVAVGLHARRSYLKGFVAFQRGEAEEAVGFFGEAQIQVNNLEFPYHGDPILFVQSKFFLAEAAIARGDVHEAARNYREFLDMWQSAVWELKAVDRAEKKLATLTAANDS